MADPVGIKAKLGYAAVAAWTTASTAPNVFLPYVDENLSLNYERIQKNALLGFGGREPDEQGNISAPGTINCELDYNNFTDIFKHVMGAEAGGVVTVVEQLSAESNIYMWLTIDKQISRHRYGAAVGTKFVMAGDHGDLVKFAFDVFAKGRDLNATAFPAGTPATPARVRMADLVFRIRDQGGAISGSDAVGIANFELEFNRNTKIDDYVTDSTNPQDPIEPEEGDFRSASLKISLPRYGITPFDFQAAKAADTAIQMDMVFTRGGETITVEMPECRILEGFDAPVGGPGPIAQEGTLNLFRSSAGNPMYVGNELRITVV